MDDPDTKQNLERDWFWWPGLDKNQRIGFILCSCEAREWPRSEWTE